MFPSCIQITLEKYGIKVRKDAYTDRSIPFYGHLSLSFRVESLPNLSAPFTCTPYRERTICRLKNGIFWDVTPRGSCNNRRFRGT
jgi:hypothetical protein